MGGCKDHDLKRTSAKPMNSVLLARIFCMFNNALYLTRISFAYNDSGKKVHFQKIHKTTNSGIAAGYYFTTKTITSF